MNIYILSNNEKKIEIIKITFQKNYPQILFQFHFINIPENNKREYFQNEIEDMALYKIQYLLSNIQKNLNNDDIIISTQTGLKEDINEKNEIIYSEMTTILLYYFNRFYHLDSQESIISNKFYSKILQFKKHKFSYKDSNIEDWNPKRFEILKNCLNELIDNIFH